VKFKVPSVSARWHFAVTTAASLCSTHLGEKIVYQGCHFFWKSGNREISGNSAMVREMGKNRGKSGIFFLSGKNVFKHIKK
jgi:hypothetical protein